VPEKEEVVQNLLGSNQHLVKREYKSRLKHIENDATGFENRTWCVVYELQPSRITIGTDILIKLPEKEYRPDIFALFERFALVVECTYTEHNSFLSEELSRLEDARRSLQNLVRREFNDRKLVLVLGVRNKASLTESIQRRAHNAGIKFIEEREVNYYLLLYRDAGIGIFYQFWARVSPSVLELTEQKLPAIRIREGQRYKYIFSIDPHELLKRVFISHREITSPDESLLGYQRMLKRSKLKKIERYLSTKPGFPAPIIVSFSKDANENFELPAKSPKSIEDLQDVRVGHLRLPTKPGSIFVVDGQHRLFGFSKLKRKERHRIDVIAYTELSGREEGEMFVDINLEQTKVPSQLLWELYPDILSQDDSNYFKAIVSNAVENLVTTDLKDFVTHISTGSKGPLTFHALCSEVVRAGLLTKQGGVVAGIVGGNWVRQRARLEDILSAFFDSLFQSGKQYPEVNKRFFLTNSGVIPLLRELGKICKHLNLYHQGRLRAAKSALSVSFSEYLLPLYGFYGRKDIDDLDHLRKSRVGSSGFISTEDEMDDKIRERIRTFPLREKRTPPELQTQRDLFVSEVLEVNRLALPQLKDAVFKAFDPDDITKQLSKPARDSATLEKFIRTVHQELVEASGAQSPENRICRVLGIQSISEIPVVRRLSLLRQKWAHRETQVDTAKKKEAIEFLRELSEIKSISNFDDLEADTYIKVQVNLLSRVRKELLLPLSTALKAF
jgi:DGQHR domain-containing protein